MMKKTAKLPEFQQDKQLTKSCPIIRKINIENKLFPSKNHAAAKNCQRAKNAKNRRGCFCEWS